MSDPTLEPSPTSRPHWFFRHAATVRVTHWVNVVCLTVLLMSGLQIFNAHPALYWGNKSDFQNPIVAMTADGEGAEQRGVTTIFGREFDTTGVLGASREDGALAERGFPAWATLPSSQSLAIGRRWHFFFAWLFVINGLIYVAYGLASRHFARDLAPTGSDMRDIGHSIVEHAKLRFPKGEVARRYNVLQKLTYIVVLGILLPLLIVAGLTMSPGIDAAFPWLAGLLGGRQSARTLHFVAAWSLVAFTLVHVLMVVLSGPWNNLRSMIVGRYDLGTPRNSAGEGK